MHASLAGAICSIYTTQFLGSEFACRFTAGTSRKNYKRNLSMCLRRRFPRRDSVLPNQDFKGSLPAGHGMRVTGRSTKIRKTWPARCDLEWLPTCIEMVRGRIPDDDLHESLSEGEGACSRTCDGRSHLPLRGKLGWMTPRPGQKRAGKRNASLGLSFPSEGPFYFLVLMFLPTRFRPL
jgi:hypothetical protein